jgi:hypothetical protein
MYADRESQPSLLGYSSSKKVKISAVGLFLLVIALTIFVNARFWDYTTDRGPAGPQDIYYLWEEGGRILAGGNPYERILAGNMLENDKYATHFPLFYLLASLTRLGGLEGYPEWISFWRFIFLFFNIGIATVIFFVHYRAEQIILALFATLLWSFNRWTLYVAWIGHVDFITIFLLLVSLLVLRKNKWLALFLFSLSLAIKHLAIFLIPLYLIWIWHTAEEKNRLRDVLLAVPVIATIPILCSVPFIIWNAEAFFRSIIFSVTREPAGLVPPSLDVIMNMMGLSARIPMFVLMFIVYTGVLFKRVSIYASVLMTMLVFVSFSPVLFPQYWTWIIPFVSLSVSARGSQATEGV